MADRADELQKIAESIASFDPGRAERYSGVWLMQQSMERRLAQVVSDVHGHLDLSFKRDSRMGNGGELPFFAGVLVSMQECLGAIARAIATADGAPDYDPVKIGPSVQLSMGSLEPEPVRVALVPAAAVLETFGDSELNLLELSVQRFVGLVNPRKGPDDFAADIAELGEKTRLSLAQLARWLADGKADLTVDWSSPKLREHAVIESYDAAELGAALEQAK